MRVEDERLERELLSAFERRKSAIAALSAEARIENYGRRGVVKGRITLLVDRGGRLRIDGWSPTDDLVATLCATKGSFGYFERGAGECLVGRPCPRNLRRFLPLGLTFEDVLLALLGVPPLRRPRGEWGLYYDDGLRSHVLSSVVTLPGGETGFQHLWLLADGTAIRYQLEDEKGVIYVMEASKLRGRKGEVRFPRRLRIRIERDGTEVVVKYRQVEIDPRLEGDSFSFECPRGLVVRELDCEDDPSGGGPSGG